MIFAIKTRWLCAKDNKWHTRTTKWCPESTSVWKENDEFLKNPDVLESSSSLMYKESK